MIAWTYLNKNDGPFFASQLPNTNELGIRTRACKADWGYSKKKEHAIELSEYWFRRFAAYQRKLGRVAYCEK